MQQFAADFNGDLHGPTFCAEPRLPYLPVCQSEGEARHWEEFQVVRQVRCEIMEVKDIDGTETQR